MRASLSLAFLALALCAPAHAADDPCSAEKQRQIEFLKSMGATDVEATGDTCNAAGKEAARAKAEAEAKKPKVAIIPLIDVNAPEVPGRSESVADFDAGMKASFLYGYDKAAPHYYRGAVKGDPGCALQLAVMYLYGMGLRQDAAQGHAWLKVAFVDDRIVTDRSMRHNFLVFLDLANSWSFPEANYAVGRAYAYHADGYYPTGDREKAKKYLNFAIGGGFERAKPLYRDLTHHEKSPWEIAAEQYWAKAGANIRAGIDAATATAQRQNRQNCEAAMKGASRPCYLSY